MDGPHRWGRHSDYKEPLPATHGTVSFQADRYGTVRPTFDVTGPFGGDGNYFTD